MPLRDTFADKCWHVCRQSGRLICGIDSGPCVGKKATGIIQRGRSTRRVPYAKYRVPVGDEENPAWKMCAKLKETLYENDGD